MKAKRTKKKKKSLSPFSFPFLILLQIIPSQITAKWTVMIARVVALELQMCFLAMVLRF